MSGCNLCSGTIEHFHSDRNYHNLTLSQRLYLFADKNKGSISLCTIAMIIAVILILKNKK